MGAGIHVTVDIFKINPCRFVTRAYIAVQNYMMFLQNELQEKTDRLAVLEKALEFKGKLIPRWSAYYEEVDDNGSFIKGPFCTRCFDDERKLIRIARAETIGRQVVMCQKCKVKIVDFRIYESLLSDTLPQPANVNKKESEN